MEVDRISSLPEEIRNHIVSFLPMEEAIRTSVLSTKWKKVCSSLSILKFEQSYFRWAKGRNLQQFIEIVYQTLFQHDESDINTFEIHFNVDDNERDAFIPHLNEWISFAANHNVRQLQIWRTGWKIFPICLVPCSSLEVLRLGGIELIPTDIEFPNLKSLTLLVVDIFDATAVHQLLCGSSLLEHMFLCVRVSSEGRSNNILHVTPPNLKFFALQGWRFHEINFVSKNIQQLFYQGEPPKFDSEILSIVREADFIVTTGLPSASSPAFIRALGLPSPASRVDHHWASKILLDLCNVTKLNLGSLYVEFLTRERDLLARLPTSCCSLKHLTVDLYATKNQVEVITFLLKSYPNLETLILKIKPQHEEDYNFNTEDYYWKTHDLNTDGMLENLRKAEIEFLQGSELEFDLVRFLLGNADVLEKMNIILSRENQINAASSSSIKEKIEMFARVSRFAAISVLETNPGQWSY